MRVFPYRIRPLDLRGRGLLVSGKVARTAALVVLLLLASGPAAWALAKVDLNTATVEQLAELPGIGPAKAEAIVAERSREKFKSVDGLERVSGIGSATMEKLRGMVTVGKSGRKSK
ncbi:MAG: ComEA family DNA-binding protein [Candidatus Binatia bacterium]